MNQLHSMRRRSVGQSTFRAGLQMHNRRVIAALGLLVIAVSGFSMRATAEDEGIALAIIYDTSGSMRETVPDASGRPAPKYQIANRALIAMAKQIQSFATNSSAG